VYNPISNEYYYANSTSGRALLNGNEIAVSHTKSVADALVAFGFSAKMSVINRYYADWRIVFDECKKGIAWICPALSICNVARGRVDAFIDFGCSYQGQAAASLILKNAGGAMRNYIGSDYLHTERGGIFTNGRVGLRILETETT
ncbi:MAG: hypothetical protein HN368_10380, partial [Spirochaetales bacterium]|nr:hypothetical protein [Spirochaetales bacterium]